MINKFYKYGSNIFFNTQNILHKQILTHSSQNVGGLGVIAVGKKYFTD